MKKVFKTMAFTLLGLVLSVNLMADSYTITFKTGSGDGTNASTSTACSTVVSAGSDYLSGNLATATKVYYSGSSGLKLGTSNDAGTLKMNLSDKGQVTPTSIVVRAKRYSSSKATKIQANSKTAQDLITSDFADYTFTDFTSKITYLEIKSSKGTSGGAYCWIESITVNYESASKTALNQVTNLSAGTPSATSATISWTGISDTELEGYKVEYKKNSETNWTVAEEKTSSTSSTLSGLTPSTTYNYRVTSLAKSTSSTKKDSDPKASTFTTSAPASHDITWYANGQQVAKYNQQEGAVLTIPADPDPATYCDGKTFVGWTATETYSHASAAPGDLFTSKDSKTVGATTAYYAVFADVEEGEPKEVSLSTSFSSPSQDWSVNQSSGTSYWKIFSGNSITSPSFDLSALQSVVVQMGTFGNGTHSMDIKANGTTLWANKAPTSSSESTSYTITSEVILSGKGTLVFTSTNSSTSAGLRIKSITIKYNQSTFDISNYTTTCAPTYEATVADGITNGSVVISKTDDAMAGMASLTGLKQGDKVYIFPTANTGYNIESVTVNGTPISAQSGKYSYTIGTEGITVSATFKAATYQITYNLDGGAWSGEAGVANYTYGTGVPTLPTNVEKANNTFDGWYSEEKSAIITSIGTTETGNKSFTAIWTPASARTVTIDGDSRLSYTSLKPTVVDKDAVSLTVTYSVNKGYTISAVAVTVNDAALTADEVVFNDEQLTITPTAGFTGNVSITFTVVEKMFTVTWMANKEQFGDQVQIQEGNKVTLPTTNPVDVISGEDTYKFQGWITDEQYSSDDTPPAYITNNTIEPTGDVTYYAVYAIVTPGPVSNVYAKITATTDLVEDGQYIIASSAKALNCDVYSSYYLTATGVTISNNKITNTNTKLVWTIEDVNGGNVLFKSNSNDNYLQIINAGSGHYNLIAKNNDDDNANKSYFTPSVNNGNWTLKSRTNSSYYVSYYSNYNEFTTNTTASDLQLYKRQNNPDTYKNYRTRVAIIDHIEVKGTPVTTNFVAGETFNAIGLSIDVYYKDEDTPTNVTSGFTFAPTGALKTTDENITFSYQGKQVLLPISVSNTVSKIEVTTDPTKMEYTEGQQFDPAGMVVTATYDNSAERDVTGYDYEPKGDLALDDKITISFGGQTKDLAITINEATKTTVNWYVNGVKLTEGEQSTAVIPGKKVTVLPTEPEACQGNQFVGWTAVDANYYNATTAPTDLFKTLVASPIIGETETNFYAVFASEAVGTYDEKVTLTSLTAPTADKFTYAFAQSSGSSSPSWNADQAKTYVKNTLTVTSKNSRVITKIEYTYNINKNDKGTAPSSATVIGNNSDNGSWDATNKTWTSSTNAATTVTLTVNGSAGNYGFTAIKVYLTGGTVLSDYSTTCLAALANPTITTAEGEYCGSVDVEITQPAGNPEGAKIMYSTDNETWNEYTAAVNITTSGTVYAKVVKDPKSTDVVSATYTVYPAYTLAQAATAASATSQIACLTFTDLLVQARTQSEAFLKASDGQIVLLNKSSHGLSVGDKLVANDAHVTFVKAHDLLQLTSTEGIAAATTGNATTPEEKTITALEAADYGKLVKIMNVTYDATNKKFTDASSKEIAVDAKFFVGGSLPFWPDGGKFNVTGIVLTNSDKVVIAPRNTEDLESLATPLDAPTDFAVTSVNSYRASYSWTTVDNNVGYTLYIYDGATEIYKSNKIGSTIETYALQKDLEAGHTYTAKLVALGDKVEHSDSPAAEVEFTTNPNAKLNWYVEGELYRTTDASQEKVVTPDDPTSPCPTNYENFVTWCAQEIEGQTTSIKTLPTVKAGDAAASQVGSAKEYNFYAVFGKIKTQGTDKYVKVTEAQDNWKGEYLIGYDEGDGKDALTVFDGSLTTLDATSDYKTVSFEEDGSIAAATNEGYQFNIEKSTTEGYYTIQSASGIYIANTTNGNKLSESSTTAYKNTISWSERIDIATGENTTASHLSFNSDQNQMRFRYYTSNKNNIVLYKRTKTNPQYSGYITTCPVTYTITIAENTKGLVEAATTTEILEGASVKLTATANAGYTKTGGNWIVKNTETKEVVDGLVGATNYLTMPDYDVTVDYNFQEIKDQFVDNLHGNTTIEKGGANYELPTLSDFSETTGKPSDAFTKFIGWSATSYDSGEPATEQPTILEGNQTATGATYFAVWYNQSSKYITEYCQTSAPANLHLVEEYHKATSVRIDWNNVDGADKYHIIVMDGGANIIADADVTESLYDLSGLTPGATYICTVKAHKDCWSDETEEFEFTTKENIQSYAVTINAEGGTYTIDPELVDGKIQEGATVTITDIAPTDADHYFFKELTVPEATDLTEVEGDYMFTMPGKSVTINIVFAEYPTVTWKMEGAADQPSIAVRNGDKFEVGTVKSAPENWKYKTYFPEFAGWVTADKCDAEGNVTTAEFITAATEVPATGLTVYGAVAKSAMPDFDNLEKITTTIDESAKYLIGAEQSSSDNTMWYFNDVVDSQWGRMAKADATENKAHLMTVIGTASAFTIQDQDGQYLAGATSKFSAMSETASTFSLNDSEIEYKPSSTYKLRHNYNNGNGGLRWYDGSTGTPAYLYKVALVYNKLTINPQPDYGRNDLVVGNYGTVCVPYAVKVADRSGATFWNIETSDAIGYTNPTSVTIVEETDDLKAGKPYIFCATDTKMALFFSGDIYDGLAYGADRPHYNGLYGNLTDATIIINEKENPQSTDEPTRGYFFVLQQKLYECGWNCTVSPNRGWVQAAEIVDKSNETPIGAPRRVIGNPNGTPTGIHNINADGFKNIEGARKYFHNNNIVIVNEGRIYNAQGIEVQ